MITKDYEKEFNRLLITIYQYILSKADRLKYDALITTDKIKRQKIISSADYVNYYRVILRYELFEEVFDEIYNLIKYSNM